MDSLWRLINLGEAVSHGYAALQDALSRRDLLSELAYMQQVVQQEREDNKVMRETLNSERRKAEHYWLLLYSEGFMQDAEGNVHKVDFDMIDDEENDEEGTEDIEKAELA